MSDAKHKRLEFTVARLQGRWGPRVILKAHEMQQPAAGIPTGFAELDQILGRGGVPLNALTLLSGQTTSGKLTLAYIVLCHAQGSSKSQRQHSVAILDLTASNDPDFLAGCGVDLENLLLVRPQTKKQAVDVLLDLVRTRQLRAILVDSLSDLATDPSAAHYLDSVLPQLNLLLKNSGCAVVVTGESQAPWQGWFSGSKTNAIQHYAALHIELQREQWIESAGRLQGYQAQARVMKSHGAGSGRVAVIAIKFDDTLRAKESW